MPLLVDKKYGTLACLIYACAQYASVKYA